MSIQLILELKCDFFKKLKNSIGSREFNTMLFPIILVAVLETLITAKIADKVTNTKFDCRKEMFSLSLSNILCGFARGLPVTAALARTAVFLDLFYIFSLTLRVEQLIESLLYSTQFS